MGEKVVDWSIGDYLSHFRAEADRSKDETFRENFSRLIGELDLMDAEFIKETRGCTHKLDPLFDRLHAIAGRLGYCEQPRGFEDECADLYGTIDKVVDDIHAYRESCTD